jgi:hypothetical protein
VLVDGGRLAPWDIVADEGREPGFPVPCADRRTSPPRWEKTAGCAPSQGIARAV